MVKCERECLLTSNVVIVGKATVLEFELCAAVYWEVLYRKRIV